MRCRGFSRALTALAFVLLAASCGRDLSDRRAVSMCFGYDDRYMDALYGHGSYVLVERCVRLAGDDTCRCWSEYRMPDDSIDIAVSHAFPCGDGYDAAVKSTVAEIVDGGAKDVR